MTLVFFVGRSQVNVWNKSYIFTYNDSIATHEDRVMLIMLDQVQVRWTADSILEFLHAHADKLRGMGVRKIGLFGSYVRGEEHAESDIDILLEMNSASYRDYMNVLHFLEDSFGRKIDLGEEHLIKDLVRPHILKEVRFAEGF